MNENLIEIYNRLKLQLKKYESPLIAKFDMDSRYDLWSVKDVVIDGRKKNEVFFAGLIIQSSYVGFYYMPIYEEPEKMKKLFSPELLKLLKGKSCFHIKKLNEGLEKEIEYALKEGYELYKERGWV
ncbi:MAG TPA: hypothetical protein DEF04_01160 [Clostridiales bacterium]|nr:hypothetical protein [Clostridiales bacterium]